MSVYFRAEVPPVRSNDEQDQWLRLKLILGCESVHEAFGISALPIKLPINNRDFLDAALLRNYDSVEASSCHDAWCDWFIGEDILDETILLGNHCDWWLLAVTGTD